MSLIAKSKWLLVAFLSLALMPGSSFGHFIWLAKSKENGKVMVFFGEGPHPGNAQFLNSIEQAKIWALDENGNPSEIKFEKQTKDDKGWLQCISESELTAVDGDCSYGVFSRGEKSMFLHYSAKYLQLTNGEKTRSSGKLPLDILIDTRNGGLKARVLFNGEPATDCEVVVYDDKGTEQKLSTNSAGFVEPENYKPGRHLLRAKMVDTKGGEASGKSFSEKIYYCTMTLDHNAAATTTSAKISDRKIPDLPVGITSFGGARIGSRVYLYGGWMGGAHNYYASGQNREIIAIDLDNPQEWKTVAETAGLQGLAMVAHNGKLYRIGGFDARNKEGDDQDLHSVADFAVFDFESKEWKSLAPMPTPRSSTDAVVIGDTIYVVGGWTMKGKDEETTWCETAISINLADKNPQWATLPAPPFQRRAISLGFQGDQLYVIGGMQPSGKTTRKVGVFDLKTRKWSDGPEIPGDSNFEGFGSSSFNVGGKLVCQYHQR